MQNSLRSWGRICSKKVHWNSLQCLVCKTFLMQKCGILLVLAKLNRRKLEFNIVRGEFSNDINPILSSRRDNFYISFTFTWRLMGGFKAFAIT